MAIQPAWHRKLKRIVYIDDMTETPTSYDVIEAVRQQIKSCNGKPTKAFFVENGQLVEVTCFSFKN